MTALVAALPQKLIITQPGDEVQTAQPSWSVFDLTAAMASDRESIEQTKKTRAHPQSTKEIGHGYRPSITILIQHKSIK